MLKLAKIVLFILAMALAFTMHAQEKGVANIDRAAAAGYFQEAKQICSADDGKLWGTSLCGPILLVDPQTREIVANQPDTQGQLKQDGEIYAGKLPSEINIANTATEWSGVVWIQVQWPLPTEKQRRDVLLMHESFHRLQKQLGLAVSSPTINSLDTLQGRFLMQLEWRALAAALHSTSEKQKQNIADALLFRARRNELFPADALQESKLEHNEGLAEYTGVKLAASSHDDQTRMALDDLQAAATKETFVRSFAYGTGAPYGLLLDETGSNWRQRELSEKTPLPSLLQTAFSISLPKNLEAAIEVRKTEYDGVALFQAENKREQDRANRIAAYRAKLVDGPVLRIPLQKMSISFNPNNLQPLEGLGTVYPTLHIVDNWGILDVSSQGALLSSNWQLVTVPAPAQIASPIHGDGWTLEIKPGWKLEEDSKKGNYVLKQSTQP